MKLFYLTGVLLLINASLVKAQDNYVANTPNSSTPGKNNTIVGSGAGASSTSESNQNVFVGYQSGNYNLSGTSNSFLGFRAGFLTQQVREILS